MAHFAAFDADFSAWRVRRLFFAMPQLWPRLSSFPGNSLSDPHHLCACRLRCDDPQRPREHPTLSGFAPRLGRRKRLSSPRIHIIARKARRDKGLGGDVRVQAACAIVACAARACIPRSLLPGQVAAHYATGHQQGMRDDDDVSCHSECFPRSL